MKLLPKNKTIVSNLDIGRQHDPSRFETVFTIILIITTLLWAYSSRAEPLDVESQAFQVTDASTKDLNSILKSSKTVGQFLKGIKSKISPRTFGFLKSVSKGHENTRYSVDEKEDGTIVVTIDKTVVPFRVERKNNELAVTLNNKTFILTPGMKIEKLWSSTLNALNAAPNEERSFLNILLPRSHALFYAVALVGYAAIVAGYSAYLEMGPTCELYKVYLASCQGNNLSQEDLNSIAKFDDQSSLLGLTCRDKSRDLRACLSDEVNAMADYRPPPELEKYFNKMLNPQKTALSNK